MSEVDLGHAEGQGTEEIERAEMRFKAPLNRRAPCDWVPIAQHFMELLCKTEGK